MKFTLVAAMGAMLSFSSCSYYERFEEPTFDWNQPMPESTTTLGDLKADYIGNAEFFLFDNAGHPKYSKTFTGYEIPADAKEIINAVVVSSDTEGNTYKKMVFRDLKDGSALDVSIDAANLSAIWPRGQKVSIDASGLDIGLYASSPSLGVAYKNESRDRQEIGRMPWLLAKSKIKAYGLPDAALIDPTVMTIAEIKAAGEAVYGQLVKIKGVKFGYYTDKNGNESFFESPYITYVDGQDEIPFSFENHLNVPVSRALTDQEGNTINLTTSSYAKFAHKGLPTGLWDIVAIVGWYRDQPTKTGSYQLSLQVFSDLTEAR